jgi:hypothetical protein
LCIIEQVQETCHERDFRTQVLRNCAKIQPEGRLETVDRGPLASTPEQIIIRKQFGLASVTTLLHLPHVLERIGGFAVAHYAVGTTHLAVRAGTDRQVVPE